MKKIGVLLCTFIVSLFLFTSNADAITLEYTQADMDFVSSSSFISFINSQDTSTGSFFVLRRWADNEYYYIKTSDSITSSLSCNKDGNFMVWCPYSYINNTPRYIISNDYTLTQNGTYALQGVALDASGGSGYYYFMYSSIDTYTVSGSEAITITDGTNSITCDIGDTCPYISAYNFYKYFYGDDTPLLTSFFTIAIDRLNYICNFITSSYIYLSIFVVFILMFVILLIRRLR